MSAKNLGKSLNELTKREWRILLLHAVVGWALCTASMGIGMATTTEQNALIIHAVGAPIFFFAVSMSYFRKYNFTKPALTGAFFVAFIIVTDFIVVAMLVMRSFVMFTSLLGTWIPFTLIFISTYVTGTVINSRKQVVSPA